MSDIRVATTILAQLGGHRFQVMTGAKHFVGRPTSLSFKLPGGRGFVKDGINYVVITLDASDTYTMEFSKVRGLQVKTLYQTSDVYADQLQAVFTRVTGLDTSLGTMKGARS